MSMVTIGIHAVFSRFIAITLLMLSTSATSMTQSAASQLMSGAQLVGTGKMIYLVWKVYEAQLHTSDGTWNNNLPYALTLKYLRDFDGNDIAKRSIKEMKKQGFLEAENAQHWLKQMGEIFPDVKQGETLTGVFNADRTTVFFKGNEQIGLITDSDFGERFFAIWLSEKTSAPSLRRKLIGEQ